MQFVFYFKCSFVYSSRSTFSIMGFLVVQICMVTRLQVASLLDVRKCHGFGMKRLVTNQLRQEMYCWQLASSLCVCVCVRVCV